MNKGLRDIEWKLPYIDFQGAFLAAIAALFILAATQVNPSKQDANANRNAEVMVMVEWTDHLCDVDLAVEDPAGQVVYYNNKAVGLAHLEFDDRGNVNSEATTLDGVKVTALDHKEYWVIRGIIPGTYHTSLHLFTCRKTDANDFSDGNTFVHGTPHEVKAKMTIQDLNPQLVIADTREVVMHKVWEEVPTADFDILPDGSVAHIDDGVKLLVLDDKNEIRGHSPAQNPNPVPPSLGGGIPH